MTVPPITPDPPPVVQDPRGPVVTLTVGELRRLLAGWMTEDEEAALGERIPVAEAAHRAHVDALLSLLPAGGGA